MISIIGAGRVGSSAAVRLAERELCDIRLFDIVEGLPQGEALDIMHYSSFRFGVDVSGSNNYKDLTGSKVVIVTAGLARKPGMTRADLLTKNAEIIKGISQNIREYAPDSIVIVVSNPMDAMTYVTHKTTGFDRRKVIGMGGLLDSSRYSFILSRELGVKPSEVNAMVIGAHGETMVPLVSQPVFHYKSVKDLLSEEQMKNVLEKVRKAGAEVIEMKRSTFHAPSACITETVESILRDQKKIIPSSMYLQGEYGISDICIGVPVKLGRNGAEKIIELSLDDDEKANLESSAKVLKAQFEELSI